MDSIIPLFVIYTDNTPTPIMHKNSKENEKFNLRPLLRGKRVPGKTEIRPQNTTVLRNSV